MPFNKYCINCIFNNIKDKWPYMILFLFIGTISMVISNFPHLEWLKNIGISFIAAAITTLIWSLLGGDPISNQIKKLEETVDTAGVIKDTGLFRFKKSIQMVGDGDKQFWYNQIRNANGDILLMSPKLGSWFQDPQEMQECLIERAIQDKNRKIHFVIMDSRNPTCKKIATNNFTTTTNADINFYRDDLPRNEAFIQERLREVNTAIQAKLVEMSIASDDHNDYFIKAKKVIGAPIFLKIEVFGDILHWSFFGYNFSGTVAPSFWINKNRSDELYNLLIKEFDLIWGATSELVQPLDITPTALAGHS